MHEPKNNPDLRLRQPNWTSSATCARRVIVDGTLAAHHKAIVLTSIDYLPLEVISTLEDFAEDGGLVMLTADCQVKIQGAGDRLAVGYWGGTLQLLDNSGKVKNAQLLPQDIAGMAWFDEILVVGLTDGRLLGLARSPHDPATK